jgi:hypothetical protein
VADLQRAVRGPSHTTEADIAKHRDELHQMRERQMARASNFSRIASGMGRATRNHQPAGCCSL